MSGVGGRAAAIVISVLATACGSQSDHVARVAIWDLTSHSRAYSEKRVRTAGYLDEVSGRLRLYLTETDARIVNDGNSVFIIVDASNADSIRRNCVGYYVTVMGTFGYAPDYGDGAVLPTHATKHFQREDGSYDIANCFSRSND